ncbi:hypothetical protein SATMO3_51500 [Sporomusa aerivorans]
MDVRKSPAVLRQQHQALAWGTFLLWFCIAGYILSVPVP